MAWRPHGRARVDPASPRSFGICDRCGFTYNLEDLKFQVDWRGNRLQNIWLRVSHQCYDTPNPQLRPIILPPDPVPVWQPRPENFAIDESGEGPE